eukprot:scaffold144946_cov21-Tisochrysis_lutea.AAC.1
MSESSKFHGTQVAHSRDPFTGMHSCMNEGLPYGVLVASRQRSWDISCPRSWDPIAPPGLLVLAWS